MGSLGPVHCSHPGRTQRGEALLLAPLPGWENTSPSGALLAWSELPRAPRSLVPVSQPLRAHLL